jgi:hypothetical protein
LLAQLNNEVTNDHESQMIGGVQQITQINNADWLSIPPQSDLKIPTDKVWFQVNVSAFHDGTKILQEVYSPVQMIDMTNNGKVDVVLTISGSDITALTQPVNADSSVGEDKIRPRTVILLLKR